MNRRIHVAIDIGAGSGRIFAGYQEDGKLKLDELHRFESEDLCLRDRHVRNVYRWQEEILQGLKCCVKRYGPRVESLGVDSFGSDFVLIDGQGNICKMPQAYRYAKPSEAARDRLLAFGEQRMYQLCGNHTMPNDTVLQLIDEELKPDSVLRHAKGMLFFGDIFHFFLCGRACNELSMASYSKMMNQETWRWEDAVFDGFGLSESLKMPIVRSGERLGAVYPEICDAVGLEVPPEVVTPAIHDTADAAFAVPDVRRGTYFNSSGSWSLLGTAVDAPVLSRDAWAFNASNSNMPIDRRMFKKNVSGMWLMQRCKQAWARYSYEEITRMAEAVTENRWYIDPDAERFFNPQCMPEAICAYVGERYGVGIGPNDVGRIARIILESLAMKYSYTLRRLGWLCGIPAERLYIVGGGGRNALLNRLSANACGIPVYAGLPEASVTGNVLCQMYGMNELASVDEAHALVRRSFPMEEYLPDGVTLWQRKYRDYLSDTGVSEQD